MLVLELAMAFMIRVVIKHNRLQICELNFLEKMIQVADHPH